MSTSRTLASCLVVAAACSIHTAAQDAGGSATLFEGARLIAGDGSAPTRRRLFVEVDGDPADPGIRDAVFYALGIGRPRG